MSVKISLDDALQIITLLKANGKMKALEDRLRNTINEKDSTLVEEAPVTHTCSCGATCEGGRPGSKGGKGKGKGKRKLPPNDTEGEAADGGRYTKNKKPCQRGGVPWNAINGPTRDAVDNSPARAAYLFLSSLYDQPEADPTHRSCLHLLKTMTLRFDGCGWNLTHETSTAVSELLERCPKDDEDQVFSDVKWMVHRILFADEVMRIIGEGKRRGTVRTKIDVWKKEGKMQGNEKYFRRLVREGIDHVQGSVYLVILLGMCQKTREFVDLETNIVKSLAEALRQPDPDTSMGKLIINKVVPFVSFFSANLPLKIKNVNCDDLEASDAWFQQYIQHDFSAPERRLEIWETPSAESAVRWEWDNIVANQANEGPSKTVASVDLPKQEHVKLGPVRTVQCGYRPSAKENKITEYPVEKIDREHWTEVQRQVISSKTLCPKNTEELVEMVGSFRGFFFTDFPERFNKMDSHFDKNGVRQPDEWVHIEPELFKHGSLKFEVKNPQEGENTLICDIMGDLPEDIRSTLIQSLQEAMAVRGGKGMVHKDSAQAREDGDTTYDSLHFVFYGRGAQGKDAPTDHHPRNLARGDNRINYHQLVPVKSKEMKENSQEYLKICDGLAKLFDWMSAALEQRHPGKFTILEIVADALPYHQSSPAHPFTGFVLNLNVVTAVHRDKKDLVKFCGVIDIGDHQGGNGKAPAQLGFAVTPRRVTRRNQIPSPKSTDMDHIIRKLPKDLIYRLADAVLEEPIPPTEVTKWAEVCREWAWIADDKAISARIILETMDAEGTRLRERLETAGSHPLTITGRETRPWSESSFTALGEAFCKARTLDITLSYSSPRIPPNVGVSGNLTSARIHAGELEDADVGFWETILHGSPMLKRLCWIGTPLSIPAFHDLYSLRIWSFGSWKLSSVLSIAPSLPALSDLYLTIHEDDIVTPTPVTGLISIGLTSLTLKNYAANDHQFAKALLDNLSLPHLQSLALHPALDCLPRRRSRSFSRSLQKLLQESRASPLQKFETSGSVHWPALEPCWSSLKDVTVVGPSSDVSIVHDMPLLRSLTLYGPLNNEEMQKWQQACGNVHLVFDQN
ncbi:hypothetical protein B0H11DRAFT_1936230 [Mycena galericulata]|nr:hypothetical protein B0H11DRAFT_1936230 [Mycena galericulata]